MKKRYLYMCMLLMAFCLTATFVKAQDMGSEDDNIINPDDGGGTTVTTTNPDGTVTYTFGDGGTLTLTPDGGYVSSNNLDIFNSNGSGGFTNATPQQSYAAGTLPSSAYPAGTGGSPQMIIDVYNPDGSTTQYIYIPGTNNGWVLQTIIGIQSTNSSQPQPPPDVPNYSTGNYTITPSGQYTYTFTFSDGSQLMANTDGTFTVVSGIGDCNACTVSQAVLDLPYYMPQPQLPPNPTQAMINAYLQGIAIYAAIAQAYHSGCPTGQYKDSCGRCVGGSSGITPCTKDCLGAWGGVTYKDSCGQCVGGSTGKAACHLPTQVICDSIGTKLDTTATKIINDLNTTPQMTQLRDSVHGTHEVALSSYDSSGTSRVFPGSFVIGNNQNVHMVPIDTTKGANHKNINALVHLHELGMDPLPDCFDLYNIVNGRVYPTAKNTFLNYSFIICGDTLTDLAVAMYDTVAALSFINRYHQDSAEGFDSTGNNPIWSSTYKGQYGGDSLSLGQEFDNAVRILEKNNYPNELIWTYAQAYMLQRYNVGARILMKVNGVFKAYTPVITRDGSGNLQDLKINICQ